MRKPVVKPFLFGSGVLLCLVLYFVGAGFTIAHEVDAGSCVEPRQQEEKQTLSRQAASKSAGVGLKKVLPRKYTRRTDIPEALLIVMLALIGVVVIARRDVSGKERSVFPEKGLKTER